MIHRIAVSFALGLLLPIGIAFGQNDLTYLGQWSINRYAPNSVSAPFGAYRSTFATYRAQPGFGSYGSAIGQLPTTSRFATSAPMLFDSNGAYRGNLSANRYDPNSISNPYGPYGSRFSPTSVHNPYGAGSRFLPDSPLNPFGTGWSIFGR